MAYSGGDLPLWLGADFVDDGTQQSSVRLLEFGSVGVRDIKVEGRVLSLKQRQ